MLTDTKVKNAKPAEKAYKLADTGNLHLYVPPTGAKVWRMRYRHAGKENTLTLGSYPHVTLAEARAARDKAKGELRDGHDPSITKKQEKAAAVIEGGNTFESIARDWHALNKDTWTERHQDDVLGSLERDVFPDLGKLPIREITAPMVLKVLREIEARPAKETARRVRQRISATFVFAIASGLAENDPAAIVQKAMAPMKKGKQPAVTTLEAAREVLLRAEAVPAHITTRIALRFLALTVVRPGTLAETPWTEVAHLLDTDEPVWTIPPARMKMRLHHKDDEAREHLVPLARQAVDLLRVLHGITGRGKYLFPNVRHGHKPMSENAIGYLLNRAGYHHRHVPHGWRATFSTVMNERLPHEYRIIDLMLAHVPKDKVEGAYNRAAHLARRRELAQMWADMLLDAMPPAESLLELRQK